MNEWQKKLYEIEKEDKKERWSYKLVILKARQIGFSTYKLIDKLDKVLFYPNTTAYIVAHKREKMVDLFEKVKLAYSLIPERIRLEDGTIWEKPKPKTDNKNEYYFPHNNSKIKITLDARSGTVTDLHISEWAFITNFRDMLRGSLHASENADITIETTANGINEFYEFWKYHNKEGTLFKTLFFPWYDHREYESEIDHDVPEDILWMKEKWIPQNKLNWYIPKYLEDPRGMQQEHPTIPDEAFLTTGSPVFDTFVLKSLTPVEGKFNSRYRNLCIYQDPGKWAMYGVDTSEWWWDWDYSVISVRDMEGNLLAFYRDKVQPDMLCEVIDYLYELWYTWIIWIERNNTWLATIIRAQDYPWYYDLYSTRSIDHKTQKKIKKYWRHTNTSTRPVLISEYEEAFRMWYLKEYDYRCYEEMFSFVYNEKGKPEAQIWSHDDCIMADAICWQMRKERTIQIQEG